MNRASTLFASGVLATATLCLGYGAARAEQKATPLAEPAVVKEAFAHVHSAGNIVEKEKITGIVTFVQAADGVKVVAKIEGLSPGKHGFHIHEKADVSSPDLKSAGPHFNPGGHKHGGPDSAEHHAGDLGNLTADEKGHAELEETFKGLTIDGPAGVVGHSVIIHQKEDDLKSDPSGESGARIAGGVIEAGKGAAKGAEK